MGTNTIDHVSTEVDTIVRQLVDLTNEKLLPAGTEPVNKDTELLMLNIFDSLAMVTLLTFVEERFDVKIPDEEVTPNNFKDFESIASLIITSMSTSATTEAPKDEMTNPVAKAIKMVATNGVIQQKYELSNGQVVHTLEIEGDGPVWLLIPGLGNPSSSWITVLQGLLGDHQAHAIDFVGFGLSTTPSDRPNFEEHYETMELLMKEIGKPPYIIVGSSAGSMIGMEMARRHPEMVKALIVTGFGLVEDPQAWWDHLQMLSKKPEDFLNAAYYRVPELNDILDRLIQDVMSRPAYWSFLEGGGLDAMKNIARDITIPTLFVSGEDDEIIKRSYVEKAQDQIPNAKLEWLARCGHFPPAEQPEELLYVIKNFLNTL